MKRMSIKLIPCMALLGLQTKAMEPIKKPPKKTTLTLSLPTPKTQKKTPRPRSASTSHYYHRLESTISNAINTACSPKKARNKETMELLENKLSSPNQHGDTYLINAIRDNNIIKTTEMLTYKNLNVNHQNEWGNTALHYAAMHKNKEIITLLLHDHRVDASIPNSEGLRARDCFITETNNEEDEHIRVALFLRAMLDIVVHEESFATLVNCPIEKDIKTALYNIKNRIAENYKYQESYQALPTNRHKEDNKETSDNNYLPDYITDEFIESMILIKLNKKI